MLKKHDLSSPETCKWNSQRFTS